jgi:hypothetical protein
MLVRSEVHSTTVKRVGYDFDTQDLEILFTSGAIYLYRLVPPEVVHQLMTSKSKGEFFNFHIRDFYQDMKVN